MGKREPSISHIRAIADKHLPKGWEVVEKGEPRKDFFKAHNGAGLFGEVLGCADPFKKQIVCAPIICRSSLYLFLHEAGHVHFRHTEFADAETFPLWLIEYEAEMYAITAMRAEGLAIPRGAVAAAKKYVARCIESNADINATVSDRVLRWVGAIDRPKTRKRR